ncbi:MAG: hypothetical protein HYY60_01325 [Parcubacteria group bacterium]|nr:hypothetical protein [Candidatus Liptonbacteria bacterium]MBI3019949.1 hypothetical protein [Parcubacteria group bacterium]MBI3075200.1 hypothetical protein [Parcubacteria group bacterium]
MPSLPKLSLLILAAGFLALPLVFFPPEEDLPPADANAAVPFFGAAESPPASGFRLSSLRASLSNFSLKNLDARIYAGLYRALGGERMLMLAKGGESLGGGGVSTQCNDGLDNDGDGLKDYKAPEALGSPGDPGCSSASDTSERGTNQCDNGIDDDGDGRIDYPNDPTCTDVNGTDENSLPYGVLDSVSFTVMSGWACDSDNYANPIDVHFYSDSTFVGATNADIVAEQAVADACGGYANHRFSFPTPSFLNDGNSHNIYAYAINIPDGSNPQLSGSPKVLGTPPQCSDGIDNDYDGFVDYPSDQWCSSPSGTSEGPPPVCADGIDNDGDGLTDYPNDPGCSSLPDLDELPYNFQCSDGIDNDNDSPDGVNSIDYYSGGVWGTGDTDCTGFDDNSEGSGGCPPMMAAKCILTPGSEVTYSLDVVLPADSNFVGNAYETRPLINWSVRDGCGCTDNPAGWLSGADSIGGAGVDSAYQEVMINTRGAVTYTLTCNKYPSCVASAGTDSDSVMITPQWSPSVSLSGPASVTAIQTVYLDYSMADIRSCVKSWDGGTLTLSGGNPQTGTLSAGFISAPTTFTMTCTGFNNNTYQASHPVGFISGPTPYFFINNINLIIIGPGSGGRSNKATVGVTPGGGFTGTINLSATPAVGSEALISTYGATLHISPTSISCTDPNPDNGITSDITCTNSEFWVETPSDTPESTYTITLTADPVPSGFESKTANIPLRVRRFVPAFEEI